MASVKQGDSVLVEGNQVIISDFATQDYEIVSYFESLPESDDLEKRLEDVLKMGIVATKSVGTAGNVNYVEKAFDSLEEKMRYELDSTFGDDGQFSEILKGHFGEDGKVIKELFDPNREGSPLHSLRRGIEADLLAIKERIGINVEVEKEAEKGTRKGIKFEEQCEPILEQIASVHSDKLERTGNESGRVSKSKKGDFVITLGDIERRIVFEMKDQKKILRSFIQKELDEAMENRNAEYGIFVVKSRESLPDDIGWFNEYDGRHLVCAMEDGEGDSLIDGEVIHIAYKWARARLGMKSAKEKRLDASFIMEKTTAIQSKIKDMKAIKIQCKNIENSAQAIRDMTKSTESAINEELDEIIESLDSKK